MNPPDLSSQTGPLSSYPVYAVGDILDVSWVTTADVVDLVINQLNSPLTEIDRTPNSASLTTDTYTWKVTTDGSDGGAKFDLTFSNVFNFMVFKVNSTSLSAQSQYFNISNATVNQHGQRITTFTSTSTTPLPASSISLSPSSASSALSSPSTIPAFILSSSPTLVTTTTRTSILGTSVSPTSASSHKALNMGANVGIGIGVGIVGLAAIAGVIIWLLFHRRKHNTRQTRSPLFYDAQSTKMTFEGKDTRVAISLPSELPVSAAQKIHTSEFPMMASQKGLATELPS